MMDNHVFRNDPKVTIIVPVYNSEEYLYRCMDSLVYQSFQEIEIIAVNNGSTDCSLAILQQYEQEFPDLVRVITTPHAERAGAGRNVGIKAARAEYIAFADSDDMMHPRAIEFLYNYAQKGSYEVVYAPYTQIKDNKVEVKRKKQYATAYISVEQALIDAEPAPWAKLFHKSLLEKAGKYPSEFSFEDLSYFFVYITKAKRIGYCPLPVYFYFWRTDSEVHTMANPRIAETVQAELYGLANCNQAYRELVSYIIALRIRNNLVVRWIFADKFLEHLVNLWPEISTNPQVYNNKALYEDLANWYRRAEKPMSKNVYLDGFGQAPFTEENIAEIERLAFYDGCSVVVLNEQTCNIDELPSLRKQYDRGNFAYVAGYFALKKIYQNGGVYLGRDIWVDLPMNFTRHLCSFFGYTDETHYSDQFFGGKAGSSVFEKILDQYRFTAETTDLGQTSLSQYIECCLAVNYSIETKARTEIYRTEISVFSPEVMTLPLFTGIYDERFIHFCHYSPSVNKKNDIAIDIDTLRWLLAEKVKGTAARPPQKKIKALEDELKKIKSSRSWKMVAWLKARKNKGIGRIIYKFYLFVYSKTVGY